MVDNESLLWKLENKEKESSIYSALSHTTIPQGKSNGWWENVSLCRVFKLIKKERTLKLNISTCNSVEIMNLGKDIIKRKMILSYKGKDASLMA